MSIIDADDYVIKEVDVYLKEDFPNELYLFQFPLRSRTDTAYTTTRGIESYYKPKCKHIQLDIPLDPNSYHYSKDKGIEYNDSNDDSLLTKQSLTSTLVNSRDDDVSYMIGKFKDDQLILNKIGAGILQFRPSFSYLQNLTDLKKKAAESTELNEKIKDIHMQVRKRETEEQLASRLKSYPYQLKLLNEEPFIKLQYFDETSLESEQIFHGLT